MAPTSLGFVLTYIGGWDKNCALGFVAGIFDQQKHLHVVFKEYKRRMDMLSRAQEEPISIEATITFMYDWVWDQIRERFPRECLRRVSSGIVRVFPEESASVQPSIWQEPHEKKTVAQQQTEIFFMKMSSSVARFCYTELSIDYSIGDKTRPIILLI